ncbi:MAG: kelch repeat-containing protein [Pseudomonadota bacterium]
MRIAILTMVAIAFLAGVVWWLAPTFMVGDNDMSEPRSEIHAATHDGTIYTAGGIGFFRTLKSCEAYDTRASEWRECPDLPRSLHHVAMAASGTRIFASGGYSSLPFNADPDAALFALDPADHGAGWQELAKLPTTLGQHAMVFRDDGLFLIGGESGGETVATSHHYNLSTSEWSLKSPMPTPRHSHAVAMDDARLYVTGGRSPSLGDASTVVEAYDFAKDTWSVLPHAPFELGGHGAAVVDGRLHVFGGESLDSGTVLADHYSLNLADWDEGWREEPKVPQPRHGFATAAVGARIYILGGGARAGLNTPWSVTGTPQIIFDK